MGTSIDPLLTEFLPVVVQGVAKDHEDGAQKDQFNIALSKIFDLANEDTGVVLRQQRESQAALHPDAVEEEVEADRFLQVDEFYVALVRIALTRTWPVL